MEQAYNSYMATRIRWRQRAIDNVADPFSYVELEGDHETGFYYLAIIGKVLNVKEPIEVVLLFQVSMAFLLFALYPAIMYRITKSIWIAVITPILANMFFGHCRQLGASTALRI